MLIEPAGPRGAVTELVLELGHEHDADAVEEEVAQAFPGLDDERRAAAWLLADRLQDGIPARIERRKRFVRRG